MKHIGGWILVAAAVCAPAGIIMYDTTIYEHPMVAFLLSVFIAVVSAYVSRADVLGRARKKTQTEWLSQAESACDRLLTTSSQVKRLGAIQAASCGEAAKLLPELDSDELRPVRSLLSVECKSMSNQLMGVHEHLESAVLDWERFIRKNCESKECQTIGEALDRRRKELARIDRSVVPNSCGSLEPLDDRAVEVKKSALRGETLKAEAKDS